MDTQTPQIDPTALALSRAIRTVEGGEYTNTKGDGGTSAGAYQWNNYVNGTSTPLKTGEIPTNFQTAAQKYNLDPTDFSQTNQDHVAYEQIKEQLDAGHSQSEVASWWNSGKYDSTGNVGYNKQIGQNYDTPSYVAKVQKAYQDQVDGKQDLNQTPQTETPQFPLTSQKQVQQDQPTDMTASNGGGVGGSILDVLGNLSGTQKLGQGLGYTIANSNNPIVKGLANFVTGTKGSSQQNLIDAQNQGNEIETNLIQQIQKDRVAGKDTSRLEKALAQLGQDLQTSGSETTNAGTGGITTGQVLGSAAQTAGTILTAPSLIKGGLGLLGVGKDAATMAKAIPYVEQATGIPAKVFSTLGRTEQLNALGEALKGAQLGDAEVISNAIKTLQPTASFVKKLLTYGALPVAVGAIADRIFGNKIGSAVKTVSGLVK